MKTDMRHQASTSCRPAGRKRFLPLFLLVSLLVAACGDEVNNHYYAEESEPTETPTHEVGKWVEEVSSLCYYGMLDQPNILYPAWLLQAEGVREMYAGQSQFAEDYITEDLLMKLKNPGAGTRVTLRMEKSEICEASEHTFVVPEEETDETLALQIPVVWDYPALLGWDTDQMVKLRWHVLLDGQEVERYDRTFNCRSLRCYISGLFILPEFQQTIREAGIGTYPIKEKDGVMALHNADFLAGYIDENSPLIDRMKEEVITDGYLTTLSGDAYYDEKELLGNVQGYAYLMQKYRLAYALRDAGEVQYMRTIDEIFDTRQAYCAEFAIAFASWCLNLGLEQTIELVPSHAYGTLLAEGKRYNIDTQPLAVYMYLIPKFSDPPTEKDFQEATSYYEYMMEVSADKSYDDEQRANGNPEYHTIYPNKLRNYLPSFNIGATRYAETRTARTKKCIKQVTNPLWLGNNNMNHKSL